MNGLFTLWEPDPVGEMLGTGYCRFDTAIGISGLARIDGTTLNVLVVIAETPGTHQFHRFIDAAKKRFDSIAVWEDWNPIVGKALARWGFMLSTVTERGETLNGWRWTKDAENPPGSLPTGSPLSWAINDLTHTHE